MPRAEADDRIRKLEEQRARINAEIQRVKGRVQQAERKQETRRKILVGAMVLDQVARGEWPEERLKAALDRYLDQERDRTRVKTLAAQVQAATGETVERAFVDQVYNGWL